MRIITGTLKGRRLSSPTWPELRPTSDRLRETLFNILGDRVLEATVLDACAGTGALGFEALSRGAVAVTFIDRDRRATDFISDHATRFGVTDRCSVICATIPPVDRDRLSTPFDLVLLDPPYDAPEIGDILSSVGVCLTETGVLVLENDRRAVTPVVRGLEAVRRVVSGGSRLDFYRSTRTHVESGQGA